MYEFWKKNAARSALGHKYNIFISNANTIIFLASPPGKPAFPYAIPIEEK